MRINFGMVGNRIESGTHIMLMLFLSIFSVLCNAYFIWYQTYILKVDVLIQWIAVGFTLTEALLGLIGVCKFFSN